MSKQENKAELGKAETVTQKLKSERNKYFVPEFGEIQAKDLADVQAQVEKLKEKQEDKDGDN